MSNKTNDIGISIDTTTIEKLREQYGDSIRVVIRSVEIFSSRIDRGDDGVMTSDGGCAYYIGGKRTVDLFWNPIDELRGAGYRPRDEMGSISLFSHILGTESGGFWQSGTGESFFTRYQESWLDHNEHGERIIAITSIDEDDEPIYYTELQREAATASWGDDYRSLMVEIEKSELKYELARHRNTREIMSWVRENLGDDKGDLRDEWEALIKTVGFEKFWGDVELFIPIW